MKTDEIRQRADVRDVIERLGLDCRSSFGEDIVVRCKSGKHKDRNPSLRINCEFGERNGLFFCFSCKWGGDIFDFVQKIKGCGFLESFDFVKRSVGRQVGHFEEDENAYESLFESTLKSVKIPGGVIEIKNGSKCFDYLVGRGVGNTDIKRFGLRDWVTRSRVFVPIVVDKTLVSWVARSYNGSNPKALTPAKSSSKNNLFGFDLLDKNDKTISIVEGWLSAIRVWQAGFLNVVATCGSKLSIEQAERLSDFERIIFWQEGDIAGKVFSVDVANWLGRNRKIVVVKLPDGTDPADYSAKNLINFFKKEMEVWQRVNITKRSLHNTPRIMIS